MAPIKVVHFVRHGHCTSNAVVEDLARSHGMDPQSGSKLLNGGFGPELQRKGLDAMSSPKYFDSGLTSEGFAQARSLAAQVESDMIPLDRVEVVVSSSLKRALQTAALGLAPVRKRLKTKVVVSDLFREYGGNGIHANMRPPKHELEAAWDHQEFDFSECTKNEDTMWPKGNFKDASPEPGVEARATAAIEWILRRPEAELAIVTHGGFLCNEIYRHRSVVWEGSGPHGSAPLKNCEVSTVQLEQMADGSVKMRSLTSRTGPVSSHL